MDDFEQKLNNVLNNPEALDKVMNIARSLNGGGAADGGRAAAGGLPEARQSDGGGASDSGAPAIDPATLGNIMRLWEAYNKGGDPQKTAVLHAMKPYLHPERRDRMDRALQTLRLVHVAREALGADILGSLFRGGR